LILGRPDPELTWGIIAYLHSLPSLELAAIEEVVA
jgi:hypothetical protein